MFSAGMIPIPVTTAIETCLAAYVLIGGQSVGYLFLRSGWPKIRKLETETKTGWGIISGAGFTISTIAVATAVTLTFPNNITFMEMLFIAPICTIATGTIIFSIKRKYFGKNKVIVSVPKRALVANLIVKKAMEKIPEEDYIKDILIEGIKTPVNPAQLSNQTENQIEVETFETLAETKPEMPEELTESLKKKIKENTKPIINKPQKNMEKPILEIEKKPKNQQEQILITTEKQSPKEEPKIQPTKTQEKTKNEIKQTTQKTPSQNATKQNEKIELNQPKILKPETKKEKELNIIKVKEATKETNLFSKKLEETKEAILQTTAKTQNIQEQKKETEKLAEIAKPKEEKKPNKGILKEFFEMISKKPIQQETIDKTKIQEPAKNTEKPDSEKNIIKEVTKTTKSEEPAKNLKIEASKTEQPVKKTTKLEQKKENTRIDKIEIEPQKLGKIMELKKIIQNTSKVEETKQVQEKENQLKSLGKQIETSEIMKKDTKQIDKIMIEIEKKKAEESKQIKTKDKIEEEINDSKRFIIESLREKLGTKELKQKKQNIEAYKVMPKSAMLLKKILQESVTSK
jgi:hypothetical protein